MMGLQGEMWLSVPLECAIRFGSGLEENFPPPLGYRHRVWFMSVDEALLSVIKSWD